MNTRIAMRALSIAASLSLVAGATFAFFSDSETSSGNTFTAGALDLQVDNTSYYNGVLNEATTWTLADLDSQLFFNFLDVKPNDEGEDTVSFHITDNPAWLCADLSITADDDVSSTEAELTDGDAQEDAGDLFDGELASNLNFFFWADDGDNVYEVGETPITQGPASDVLGGQTYTLADSTINVFTGLSADPLDPAVTHYLGKAWCFGELAEAPVAPGENDPTVNPGVTCDGTGLDNQTQTDTLTGDITFRAVQARSNEDYVCAPPEESLDPTSTPSGDPEGGPQG